MSVLLIKEPPFSVDFSRIEMPDNFPRTLCQKVDQTARDIFAKIVRILKAITESFFTNARYSWTTFKYIVLGFNGRELRPPTTNAVLFCRLSIWAVAHTIGFVAFSIILYVQKSRGLVQNVVQFTSKQINLRHFVTKKTDIDVSKVPATIQVKKLLELFNTTNFTDPEKPGYMPETCRREDKKTFSIQELRTHLEVFVRHVQSRTPFVGTPPSYMAPQLMRFYEQIEKAVRYSLHTTIQRHDDFLHKHAGQIPPKDDPEYQTYKNLLEDQSRIAIDMAIAGAHCGARYMSDAMDTYFNMQEDPLTHFETVHDHLCNLLANKREKIARAHIEEYMGTDAHAFSSYMANMGTLLAIPGTENIIEYLTGNFFNKPLMLQRFFAAYTPQSIRQTVQDEIKKSQPFRERLFDWFKDQSADWKKEYYEQLTENLMQMLQKQKPDPEKKFYQNIDRFLELCKQNTETKLPDPKIDFNAFLDELFTLETTKSTYSVLERHTLKMALKKDFIKDALIQATQDPAIHDPKSVEQTLKEKAAMLDEALLINQTLCKAGMPALEDAILLGCLKDKKTLKMALLNHVDKIRQFEFLEALTSDEHSDKEAAKVVEKKGLKSCVLDWVLISNQILYC